MIKKIVALCLAVMLLCLYLSSCSPYGEDVPEGMQPSYAEATPSTSIFPRAGA